MQAVSTSPDPPAHLGVPRKNALKRVDPPGLRVRIPMRCRLSLLSVALSAIILTGGRPSVAAIGVLRNCLILDLTSSAMSGSKLATRW